MKITLLGSKNGSAALTKTFTGMAEFPTCGVFKSISNVVGLPNFSSGTFVFKDDGMESVITVTKVATKAEREAEAVARKAKQDAARKYTPEQVARQKLVWGKNGLPK
jgi:hypothetical protein